MRPLVQTFTALADETRFAIVERLMDEGELPAGKLAAPVGISAPAVSRHLKVLRGAGVIEQRVVGTHRLYRVNPDAMRAISGWTMDHRAFWEAGLDRLQAALDAGKGE